MLLQNIDLITFVNDTSECHVKASSTMEFWIIMIIFTFLQTLIAGTFKKNKTKLYQLKHLLEPYVAFLLLSKK